MKFAQFGLSDEKFKEFDKDLSVVQPQFFTNYGRNCPICLTTIKDALAIGIETLPKELKIKI